MINVTKETFDEFMTECGKAPLLTTEQEKLYIEQAQQGDQEAMQAVLNANMRFVVSIANTRKGNLDIISAIRIAEPGLIYAVKHYDTASDIKFLAYAAECMKECIKNNKTKIFVDMDGVLVNFQSGIDKLDEATKREYADDGQGKAHYDDVPGIFATIDPMPGALDAVRTLQAMGYDLYILSTAPWGNPSAWADKVAWVTKHLDDVFHKKMIVTHCKGLLAAQEGAYLIDDRTGHGASDFGERHILFGQELFPDWTSVVDFFRQLASLEHPAN